MKQMRSRFRLLTLLLVCAFLLTLAVCTGNALRTAGISLSSLLRSTALPGTVTPDPSVSPDSVSGTDPTPAPSDDGSVPESFRDLLEGTDNTPDPEYNTEGL